MKKHGVVLIMMLAVVLFIPACAFLGGHSSSETSETGQTSGTTFTPEQVLAFAEQLNTQKDMRFAKSMALPAYSFYRFDVSNLAGGQRLSSIVSYDQAASMTFGMADTAKVLLFDAMGRKAGYSFDYFAFLQTVPAATLDTLTKAVVDQCADAEFIVKSPLPLASGPVVAAALEAAVSSLPLPAKADFIAVTINRPSLAVTPTPLFPQLDLQVVQKIALSDDIQSMYMTFLEKEPANLSFFKSSVPLLNIPRARIRSASSTLVPPASRGCVYDDTWWEYSDFNIGLQSAVGTISGYIATATIPTTFSVSSREDVDGRKVLVTYQGNPVFLSTWHGKLEMLQIVLYEYHNDWSNGSCINGRWVGSLGSGKTDYVRKMDYDIASFVYSEPMASTTIPSLWCEVRADGAAVASFVATSGMQVTQAVSLPAGKVATVAFFLTYEALSENEWNLLASQTIDRLYPLQIASVPDLQYYANHSDSSKRIENLKRDPNSVADWVKTFGNASPPRTLLNLDAFRKTRFLIAERSVTIAGIVIIPGNVTVSGIATGTFTTNQTFTVSGATSGNTVQYSLDNGTTWVTYTGAVTLSSLGTSVVTARQIDSSGNAGPQAPGITITIQSPPASPPAAVSVSNIATGTFKTSQTFTVTGATSGNTVQYSLDNGTTWTAYSTAVPISTEGTVIVTARQGTPSGTFGPPSAGITVTIDTTAPIIAGTYPSAGEVGITTFSVKLKAAEAVTAHVVAVTAGATAPSGAQIKAGTDAAGAAAPKTSVTLPAGTETIAALTGATAEKSHDVYTVIEDTAGNLSSAGKVAGVITLPNMVLVGTMPSTWASRSSFALVSYQSRLWTMFGETGASTMVNDIWNSSDGSAWTEQTIAGTPVKRGAMGYAVYNDKVWIVGGIPNGAPGYFYGNVVSFDGTSWATVLDNGHGQFQPRRRHSIVPFNPGSGEVLWLYAGNDGVTGSGGYTNNQYSANTAATIWTAQAAPSWSAREQQAMTAFNNQLWLLGGNDGSNKLNDCLFSSNGTTWTVATTPGNLARTGARLVSHNNRLYAFGGAGTSGALKDLWSTTDGTTWKEVTQLPITARSDFGMVSFNGKLWIIGGKDAAGNYLKDIWTYTEP